MGKKKKQEHENIVLPGQITIFDLLESQKVEKITIKGGFVTEKPKNVTEIAESCTKSVKLYTEAKQELTEEQQKILDKFKDDDRVIRKIHHACGRLSIEIKEDELIRTIHFDREGKNIFEVNNQIPVLPKDKILYYAPQLNNTPNELQMKKIDEVKDKYKVNRTIHRGGDYNILMEHEGGVISINRKGWILEFELVKKVECTEDEIIKDKSEVPVVNLEEIQQSVKQGDIVEAQFGEKTITGEITWVYGSCNESLNIRFDNGTKHTAIHRSNILRVVA